MSFKTSRRLFIKSTALTALASSVYGRILANEPGKEGVRFLNDKKNLNILFQGDSITDAGRNTRELKPNIAGALGNGYALYTATNLLTNYPDRSLQIYNKGVSGNKVYQLAERWDTDCLALKPDVLSILVGVNDLFHAIRNGYAGTIETFRQDYIKLLNRTKEALPDTKLIIGEPFLTKGIRPESENWYPGFTAFQETAREMADRYQAVFIPYQAVFDKALELAPARYWSLDGIHPTVAGAGLMAKTWLEKTTMIDYN